MKVAIMQPYFFPYIGYFQLIAAVDKFIVYDNIKYTKKGWINRNRMLLNGSDAMFSLPLKRDSDHLYVAQRELSDDFDSNKLLNQLKGAYFSAPYFDQTYSLMEGVIRCRERNLFKYIYNAIVRTCDYLGIQTEIIISSNIAINHELKSQDKVISLCKAAKADTYINTIGGKELYLKEDFKRSGIELQFIKSNPFIYPQFKAEFVPWLSIVDVMMFNSLDEIKVKIASGYEVF